jgi:hypothetical protein
MSEEQNEIEIEISDGPHPPKRAPGTGFQISFTAETRPDGSISDVGRLRVILPKGGMDETQRGEFEKKKREMGLVEIESGVWMGPLVTIDRPTLAFPKYSNEPCACGSGKKSKRCCGRPRA